MSTKHAQVSSEGSKSCRGVEPQYYGNEQQQQRVLWRAPGQFETTGDDEGEEDDDDNSDRTTSTTAGGDQYSQQGEADRGLEAEPMFEKPLTPSDVGKLNRLVIPKQYAERYLPLAGGGGDSKALHLCFEDECGKPWRFRYSYWNSSQSYVLTKGWSRYVKEKRLDAGDVVSFHRRAGDQGLSIRWRRRRIPGPDVPSGGAGPSSGPTVLWAPLPAASPAQYASPTTLVYVSDEQEHRSPLRDHAGEQMLAVKLPPPPPANSKRLRLFGVNLDCPSEDHLIPDPTKLNGPHHWTQTQAHRTLALFHDSTSHSL